MPNTNIEYHNVDVAKMSLPHKNYKKKDILIPELRLHSKDDSWLKDFMHTSYLCGNETELTGKFQYAASGNHGFILVNGCQWLKCTMHFFKQALSLRVRLEI